MASPSAMPEELSLPPVAWNLETRNLFPVQQTRYGSPCVQTPEEKAVLQRAANVSDESVSEFLPEAGINAAYEALIHLRPFKLVDSKWQAFQEVLSRPVVRKRRLARLLAEKSVLE